LRDFVGPATSVDQCRAISSILTTSEALSSFRRGLPRRSCGLRVQVTERTRRFSCCNTAGKTLETTMYKKVVPFVCALLLSTAAFAQGGGGGGGAGGGGAGGAGGAGAGSAGAGGTGAGTAGSTTGGSTGTAGGASTGSSTTGMENRAVDPATGQPYNPSNPNDPRNPNSVNNPVSNPRPPGTR
jgi:hypothetical protein